MPLLTLLKQLRERLKAFPGAVKAVRFGRSWLRADQRTLRRIRSRTPGLLLQPAGYTEPDRYPDLFAFVAKQLEQVPEPRILSFGCATGEEVFSLRRWLPRARIVGMDINPRAIAAGEAELAHLPVDPGIRFVCAGSVSGEVDASYDAIFCMAVLRHSELQAERPERCDAILPFSQAERTAGDLARCLKPGGLLVIWNCHFRFADMAAAAAFEVALQDDHGALDNQPLYGPDNRLMPRAQCLEAVFRKHSG